MENQRFTYKYDIGCVKKSKKSNKKGMVDMNSPSDGKKFVSSR